MVNIPPVLARKRRRIPTQTDARMKRDCGADGMQGSRVALRLRLLPPRRHGQGQPETPRPIYALIPQNPTLTQLMMGPGARN
eukprot:1425551-Rhodomonas_salina.2